MKQLIGGLREHFGEMSPRDQRQARFVYLLTSIPIILIDLLVVIQSVKWAIVEPHNIFAIGGVIASVFTLALVSWLVAWIVRNVLV